MKDEPDCFPRNGKLPGRVSKEDDLGAWIRTKPLSQVVYMDEPAFAGGECG